MEGPFPWSLGLTEKVRSKHLLFILRRNLSPSLTLRICLEAHKASVTRATPPTVSPAPRARSQGLYSKKWSSLTVQG